MRSSWWRGFLKHPLAVGVTTAVVGGLFALMSVPKPIGPDARVCNTTEECSTLTGISTSGAMIVPYAPDAQTAKHMADLICAKARKRKDTQSLGYDLGVRNFNCGNILSVVEIVDGKFSEGRRSLCKKNIDVITSVDCSTSAK